MKEKTKEMKKTNQSGSALHGFFMFTSLNLEKIFNSKKTINSHTFRQIFL